MRKIYWIIILIVITLGILGAIILKNEDSKGNALQYDVKQNTGIGIVSDTQYFRAIKELDSEFAADPRVIEMFTTMDPRVSQLYINGDDKYIVAWNNFGFTSVLIVFKLEDSSFTPIYLNKPGRDITAVKLMDLGLDINFVEVTSYFNTGGHTAQKTKLLSLQSKQVVESWELETITVDAGKQIDKSYSSYTIFPPPFSYDDEHMIVLHQVIDSNKSIEESVITFIWDEKQKRFIQR